MESLQNANGLPRPVVTLLAAASLVILLMGMQQAAQILATFFLALVITIGLSPLPARIARRGVPMWLAFLITVVLALVFIVGLAVLLGGALVQFVNAVPKYAESLNELTVSVNETLIDFGIDVTQVDIGSFLEFSRIASLFGSFASSILGVLSNTSLLLLMIFFMLLDAIGFGDKLEVIYANRAVSTNGIQRFAHDTRRYIIITAWTGALVGVVNAVILSILGVDFPILWGVLAFLFSFIPNIGFMLSMIPPVVLALLEFGWQKALIVVVAYIVINAGVDNVLKPKVIGDDLDLSLATTFLSLVLWSWVLGPVGGILAVPMTLLVKHLFLESNDESRWLSQLMSLKPPKLDVSSEDGRTLDGMDGQYAEEA